MLLPLFFTAFLQLMYSPTLTKNRNILPCHSNSKLLTTVVSTFTAYYIHLWPQHLSCPYSSSSPTAVPDDHEKTTTLSPPMPSFDGRVVLYPTYQNLRDYVAWRQADCAFLLFQNFSLATRGGPSEALSLGEEVTR